VSFTKFSDSFLFKGQSARKLLSRAYNNSYSQAQVTRYAHEIAIIRVLEYKRENSLEQNFIIIYTRVINSKVMKINILN